MDKIDNLKIAFVTIGGVLGATVAFLYGGWYEAMSTLLVFQAFDFATGVLVSTLHGYGDSRELAKGLIKKLGMWVALAVAYRVDITWSVALGLEGTPILMAGLGAYNLAELYSITENLGRLGVMTDFLSKFMKQVETEQERKEQTNDNR